MLEFNIPSIQSTINDNKGVFVIEPLERGYGVTLGNSLRRVMLSSLPGAAVTYIKIDGVLHEFSSIKGVKEDVTEIVLNVKGIVPRMYSDNLLTGYIDVVGPRTVTAGDIKCDSDIDIINPDQVICSLGDGARLSMELGFATGRGYATADDNKAYTEGLIGAITIDSIFTPIHRVSYTVENTRVGSKVDYDKLIIEVDTDGSITPTDSMSIASNIIIKHFECVSALSANTVVPSMVPDEETQKNAVLDIKIEEFNFSVRSYNCLKRAGIDTLGDLTQLTLSELIRIRNLGKKSYEEIVEKVHDMNQAFKEEE